MYIQNENTFRIMFTSAHIKVFQAVPAASLHLYRIFDLCKHPFSEIVCPHFMNHRQCLL